MDNLSWSLLCLASHRRVPRAARFSAAHISRMRPQTFMGHQRRRNGIEVADEERRELARTHIGLWAVPIMALTTATLPYALQLASQGLEALRADPGFGKG